MSSDWGILKAILYEQCEELYEKTLLTLWIIAALPVAAFAQDRIYRCGNEYTNNATQAKERGCKWVEGGNVTVIQGSRPSGGGALRPVVGRLPHHLHRPVGLPRWKTAVTNNDQRARDSDARASLEAELRKAEARHAELVKGNTTAASQSAMRWIYATPALYGAHCRTQGLRGAQRAILPVSSVS